MTLPIVKVWITLKPKMNYLYLFDRVRFLMKTRHDNDMTDLTSMVYAENEIELS